MDPIQNVLAFTPAFDIAAFRGVAPVSGLLAAQSSSTTLGVFGGASSVIELSGLARVLSVATTFRDRITALQVGDEAAGDFAGLATRAQGLVDNFNALQADIARINTVATLSGGALASSSVLTLALDGLAQSDFTGTTDDAEAAPANLTGIGIGFQPAQGLGSGSRLSLDAGTLESAFNNDPAETAALLARATQAFGDLAEQFVGQAGGRFSASLGALALSSGNGSLFGGDPFGPSGNTAGLLLLESLLQPDQTGSNLGQVVTALNQYRLVSTLLA